MKAECPECDWSKKVPERARGKKGKCPNCGSIFRITEHSELEEKNEKATGADVAMGPPAQPPANAGTVSEGTKQYGGPCKESETESGLSLETKVHRAETAQAYLEFTYTKKNGNESERLVRPTGFVDGEHMGAYDETPHKETKWKQFLRDGIKNARIRPAFWQPRHRMLAEKNDAVRRVFDILPLNVEDVDVTLRVQYKKKGRLQTTDIDLPWVEKMSLVGVDMGSANYREFRVGLRNIEHVEPIDSREAGTASKGCLAIVAVFTITIAGLVFT